MKTIKLLALGVLLALGGRFAWMRTWVPCRPLQKTIHHTFIELDMNEAQRKAMIAQLRSMGLDFKVGDDDRLWVRRSLDAEEDLLSTLTHKAYGIPPAGPPRRP